MIGQKVILTPRYDDATLEKTGLDIDAIGDKALYNIPFKCNVLYAGCTVTTIISGDAVVAFDRRQTAGSDGSDRTDATIASITLPDTTAVGTMVYDKAAQDDMGKTAADLLTTAATCRTAGGYWDGTNCKPHPYGELQPGNEVVVQMAASGGSGNVVPILVVEVAEEVFGNLDNVLETA